jgi:hypothetical protein
MKETQQSTKLERHIDHLQEEHDRIDQEIKDRYKNYDNDILISDLKKKKLNIKDEIELYKKDMATLG